jgi:transcriptional regulator with XRE-family HTH domain
MAMPERSFGRTVRYRRTKLGLSQAKLGELVGRSTATIRSWERDKSRPNDPKVLAALAAILGVNEKHLFGKADVEPPLIEETSPTVEQALATLTPSEPELRPESVVETGSPEPAAEEPELEEPAADEDASDEVGETAEPGSTVRELVGASSRPAYVAPPDPYQQTPLTPTLADISYMEDRSQRQMYRVRTLATLVAFVALVVAFIWALGEGLGALGEWWDAFFGNLRL